MLTTIRQEGKAIHQTTGEKYLLFQLIISSHVVAWSFSSCINFKFQAILTYTKFALTDRR